MTAQLHFTQLCGVLDQLSTRFCKAGMSLPSAHWLKLGFVGIVASVLAACSTTQPNRDASRGSYKVGQTYTVMGQTYTPHEDYSYSETGQASWYGPGFHGRRTANGERYDQTDRSAAHRTLPMPSVVLVTNLDNGLSTMVRVNDRGPFARNRIIDLSRTAADDIGMITDGVANVRVDILRRESEIVKDVAINGGGPPEQTVALLDAQKTRQQQPPPAVRGRAPAAAPVAVAAAPLPPPAAAPAPPPVAPPPMAVAAAPAAAPPAAATAARAPAHIMYIQAGAFGSMANAQRARNRISAFGDAAIASVTVQGQEVYRVRIGPMADATAATATLDQVQRAGFADARIVTD
jgi:rare lipoprotein A